MTKDILTTADVAKLLGVSVRTAQVLIEGGAIPSWKTPGGHRRVYHADVLALIDSKQSPAETETSAILVVVAANDRLPTYRAAAENAADFSIDYFDDALAALVTIGSARPFGVLVDCVSGLNSEPLLRSLAADKTISATRIIAVGGEADVPADLAARVSHAATPAQALATLRGSAFAADDAGLADWGVAFPVSRDERRRLMAVERSGLLNSENEEGFDRLTWLAAQTLDTPIALLTLLTPTKQWFKSKVGLDMADTPRSWAFCNHTILQREVFTVPDLSADPRFADNPAVAGEPRFRFYAGAPVVDDDGFIVGSLCVIDRKPRVIGEREMKTIQALAAIASDEVRLRALDRRLRSATHAKR
ncbi:GAF domain-containing protein [Sphingomonas sp. NFR15]|uniref:GAF domain-containing protein n=1 Tax=Sphingomonas sp. NFR15 TaxID=1566282 RepID=UPI00088D1B6E|nr:GAF domain-containing protein [Sphingomonas sp. NFR15]SDA24842.1 DNA binding domain-containing protein, excisionase family [Sphingomonas sp. NFR15]